MNRLLAVFPILFMANLAQAEVCISIAEDRDTLEEIDRKGVLTLAKTSFEAAGETIIPAPCTNEYKLANVLLGSTVTATISGPKGDRRGQALTVGDLGNVYDQMIRSLISGKPVSSETTRENVTLKQANPNRLKADSLTLFRLGTGYVLGSDFDGAPVNLGFGYRYELDHWAVDLGGEFTIGGGAHTGLFVGALYFLDGLEDMSPYFGAALGYGGTVLDGSTNYTGGGLETRFTAGYSLFRTSTIRMLVEFNATLPLYSLDPGLNFDKDKDQLDVTKYAPIFGLSIGVGY